MTTATSFRANLEDTTFERLEGQTIIINLTTGSYFSLSGSAADVFFLCCSGASREAWWDTLINSYSSLPVREDVEALIDSLLRAGLIVSSERANITADVQLPHDFVRGDWTRPQLEEFEDLRDLILVDPIQDIANLGWPYIKEVHY
jgi:hypothetical protein